MNDEIDVYKKLKDVYSYQDTDTKSTEEIKNKFLKKKKKKEIKRNEILRNLGCGF